MREPFVIDFTDEEMIEYLKAWGYTVKPETRKFWRNVCRDDVEEYSRKVLVVYKNGKEQNKNLTDTDYEHDRVVRKVFEPEFKKRLTKIL